MDRREPLIFIVSGEASGDNLAGRLMAALKRKTGGRIRFAGVGGPQSEGQGLASLFPMSELSVMGLAEVLPHLPRLIGRINETAEEVERLMPDAVVTVDSPGFCLRLAHHLRGSGIPVIHYVAPQLWAWGPFRARKLKKRVDHIMALLPFEVPFFARYGIACTYVGHPAIDAGAAQGDGKLYACATDARRLPCVPPGSRAGEVRRMPPCSATRPGCSRTNILASNVIPSSILWIRGRHDRIGHLTRRHGRTVRCPAAANAAMASRAPTLELALAGPMVVAYRSACWRSCPPDGSASSTLRS
jgi:lipid-A-disaccharide synthase